MSIAETKEWFEEDDFTGTLPSARDKLASAVLGDCIWYFGGFGPLPRGPLDAEDDGDWVSDKVSGDKNL